MGIASTRVSRHLLPPRGQLAVATGSRKGALLGERWFVNLARGQQAGCSMINRELQGGSNREKLEGKRENRSEYALWENRSWGNLPKIGEILKKKGKSGRFKPV